MDDEALRGLGPMADAQSQARVRRIFSEFKQLSNVPVGWNTVTLEIIRGNYHR
jgi:hypothetical protein